MDKVFSIEALAKCLEEFKRTNRILVVKSITFNRRGWFEFKKVALRYGRYPYKGVGAHLDGIPCYLDTKQVDIFKLNFIDPRLEFEPPKHFNCKTK